LLCHALSSGNTDQYVPRWSRKFRKPDGLLSAIVHRPQDTALLAVACGAPVEHDGLAGTSFLDALYFSAETFSSLEFGDITPAGPLRLIAGSETLVGLLLIGWSASYTFVAMERFWAEAPSNNRTS
jgi:hypothetical protein